MAATPRIAETLAALEREKQHLASSYQDFGLKRQEAAGVTKLTPDGRTPSQQLRELRDALGIMHAQMEMRPP